MPKEKKKEKVSWKEKRRQAALKHQRAVKAERLRSQSEPKKGKRWSRNKILAIGFFALVFLIVAVYAVLQGVQPSPNRELAPTFTLTDLDGSTVSLEALNGKVVVLDFFATTCNPCKEEMADLAQIKQQYSDNRVQIISIASSSDSETSLQQFRDQYDMTWIVARDTSSQKCFDKYSVSYIPTLVIVDQEGYINYRKVGLTDADTLSREIDKLVSS